MEMKNVVLVLVALFPYALLLGMYASTQGLGGDEDAWCPACVCYVRDPDHPQPLEAVDPVGVPLLPTHQKSFLVISDFRTGSTALVNQLNGCDRDLHLELYLDFQVPSYGELKRRLDEPKSYKVQRTAFYKHYNKFSYYFKKEPERHTAVVVLYRRNFLAKWVSYRMATSMKNDNEWQRSVKDESWKPAGADGSLVFHFVPDDVKRDYDNWNWDPDLYNKEKQQYMEYVRDVEAFCNDIPDGCIFVATEDLSAFSERNGLCTTTVTGK
jgi:hypothetical protein